MNRRTRIKLRLLASAIVLLLALGCKTASYTNSETEEIYSDTIYLAASGSKNEKNDESIKNLKELFGDDLKVIQTTSDLSEFTPPEIAESRRLINPYGIGGRVVLRVLIDENGNVLKAMVIEGENAHLNMLSLQWMKRWKFKPMTCKGVAVRSIAVLPLNWED